MMTVATENRSCPNGLDMSVLQAMIRNVEQEPDKGKAHFSVTSAWCDRTRSQTRVEGYRLGSEWIPRPFTIDFDEPHELLGENKYPNPQEYLLGALNACMIVGYVAAASIRGITLEKLEIHTDGELDLRGFLGLDSSVKPGYETIRYTVRIKGDGTPEQFEEIHESVMFTSPLYFNIASAIRLEADLVVE
jgi:uncharacterized OsmC-like protein